MQVAEGCGGGIWSDRDCVILWYWPILNTSQHMGHTSLHVELSEVKGDLKKYLSRLKLELEKKVSEAIWEESFSTPGEVTHMKSGSDCVMTLCYCDTGLNTSQMETSELRWWRTSDTVIIWCCDTGPCQKQLSVWNCLFSQSWKTLYPLKHIIHLLLPVHTVSCWW